MANEHDLEFLGSQFALELEGVEMARFTGCSGLSYSTEVVEYQDTVGGKIIIRKRPGRTKYDDIVLKRGLSADSAIIDWHTKVLKVPLSAPTDPSSFMTMPEPKLVAGTLRPVGLQSGALQTWTPEPMTS